MPKIEAIPVVQGPMEMRMPENYTHVSGIYSENNMPMFLSFLDNVRISPPPIGPAVSAGLSHPVADSRSARLLRSILAARIPAAQSPVVWDDEELLP